MTTSVQVILSRSFLLHAKTYRMQCRHSSGISLWFTESSRKLFFNRSIAVVLNSSLNHKSTRYDYSRKCLHSQARCSLVSDILLTSCNDDIINNSTNCNVTTCYSSTFSKHIHSQAHRGLMMDIAPISRSDDGNTSREQTRSTPMNIEELVEFLQDENASDICVIRLPPHLDYVNYFVICSGFGGRHLGRMANGLVTEVNHDRL